MFADLSDFKPAVHAKTAEQSARIKEAVKSNMLYAVRFVLTAHIVHVHIFSELWNVELSSLVFRTLSFIAKHFP